MFISCNLDYKLNGWKKIIPLDNIAEVKDVIDLSIVNQHSQNKHKLIVWFLAKTGIYASVICTDCAQMEEIKPLHIFDRPHDFIELEVGEDGKGYLLSGSGSLYQITWPEDLERVESQSSNFSLLSAEKMHM